MAGRERDCEVLHRWSSTGWKLYRASRAICNLFLWDSIRKERKKKCSLGIQEVAQRVKETATSLKT